MTALRSIAILLTVCAVFVLTAALLRRRGNRGLRLVIIQTFVVFGAFTWLITEVLSALRQIGFAGFAAAWTIVAVFLSVAFFAASSRRPINRLFARETTTLSQRVGSLPIGQKLVLAYLVIVLGALGLTAFVGAPNTRDSMIYHLSRVLHWEQDRSLDYYPTNIQRQLHLGPAAEMAILNLQVLSGNDQLDNFVQYFAMIGCLIGSSLIVQLLGGDSFIQTFAVLGTATIPMGVLQATSTQNDYVVALWMVCFVVLSLRLIKRGYTHGTGALAGLSLGLGILTKATALLYALPIALWLVIELFRQHGMKTWRVLVIPIACGALVLVPYSMRNIDLYGNPMGPMVEPGPSGDSYTNSTYSLAVLASNVVRNASLQLALPVDSYNERMEAAIESFHQVLGLAVSDARTTWNGEQFHVVFSRHEVRAGNPIHFLLIALAFLLLIKYRERELVLYVLCVAGAFLLFCFFLKWQPWNSRLQLPLFVMAMPPMALILGTSLSRQSVYTLMGMMVVVATSAYLFINPLRPLMGPDSILVKDRASQYFADNPELFASYTQAAATIQSLKCNQIGLITGSDDPEYLFWMSAGSDGILRRIESIQVDNASEKYRTEFTPCVLVSLSATDRQQIAYGAHLFQRIPNSPPVAVFRIVQASQHDHLS